MNLKDILKVTGNQFASIADDGIASSDISGYIDSGSYAFNALLSANIFNGYPRNRIFLVGAASSTGKTYLAISAVKNFLEQNPDGLVLYFESESAVTKEMFIKRGIDVKRLGIIPVSTVQEFKHQAIKILDNYEKDPVDSRIPIFMVLDSMGMLSTTKEIEDTSAGNDTRDMTRAQQLKSAFRVLTLRLGRANIPLFVTNHVYDAIGQGPHAAAVQSGGNGSVYASSTILTMSKAKHKDSDGNVTGAIITITATKSRQTKENTKIKCLIKYNGGLDRYFGLLEIAEAAGIFKKVSTRYELPDGTKVFGKSINENPEKYYTHEILEMINEYVKDVFDYGVTNEKVFSVDEFDHEVENL